MKKILLALCIVLIALSGLAASETADQVQNRAIVFDADSYIVYIGKPLKLKAVVNKVSDDAPVSTAIVWSSSDDSVVTVSSTGSLSGKSAGMATITATAKDDETIKTSVNVEVRIPVKSVAINEKKVTLLAGAGEEAARASLSITITPEDAYYQTGTWSSSKEDVVSVDENGNIIGLSAGTATISFASDDPNVTKKAQLQVKVNQAVTAISLNQKSINIPIKKSTSIKAAVEPVNAVNKKVEWSSDDESIAVVNASGQITGKSVGSTIVHATTMDGSGISASAKVEVVQPITKIEVADKKLSLPPSISRQIDYTILPENATKKEIQWTSSNAKVASVDASGAIRTLAGGKCNIIGTAMDGSNVKVTVAVTVKSYDVVFTDRWSKKVDFVTDDSYSAFMGVTSSGPVNFVEEVKVTFKNGCVQSGGDHTLVPVKTGEDKVTITVKRNGRRVKTRTYTVYVAENAFDE